MQLSASCNGTEDNFLAGDQGARRVPPTARGGLWVGEIQYSTWYYCIAGVLQYVKECRMQVLYYGVYTVCILYCSIDHYLVGLLRLRLQAQRNRSYF